MTRFQKNITLRIIVSSLLVFVSAAAYADLEELWDSVTGSKPTREAKKKGYWVDLSGQGVCTLRWDGTRLVAAKHPLEQKSFWTTFNTSTIMNDGIRYEVAFPDSFLTTYDEETKKLFVSKQILLSSGYECRRRY